MSAYLIISGAALAALASLFFSTLSYALRDFSRPRLQEQMNRFGKGELFEPTADHAGDLIFVTATARLFANIMVLICVLRFFHDSNHGLGMQYFLSIVLTGSITLLVSVAIPNAASKYAGETMIAVCIELLEGMRLALTPVTKIMHFVDHLARSATGADESPQPQMIEEEILSVVEEGEKEGVVDVHEREMFESLIEFRDTTVAQIMTARPDISAIELPASLKEVERIVAKSGHSRIPVFEESLDRVVGILYARDLLHFLGGSSEEFDLRRALRPAFYVPESKPVRDLLSDFRLQKVHIAIVLDEYGGTTGLVTIEDIFEELVGDISDEHEATEPALLKRLNDLSWEADGRVPIDELNRTLGLSLPEEAGYETLGGFVSTTLGSIPAKGTLFEQGGVKYTILEAEPQKVNRIRIDLSLAPVKVDEGQA